MVPQQKKNHFSEVFIAQPDPEKEALAGRLFILMELNIKRVEGIKIVNFLIDYLNHHYYQNDKLLLREKVHSLKVEHIFESVLARSNKSLIEFLKQEKIKLTPQLADITVGIIYKNQLHFSNVGKNRALLVFKKEKEGETEEYKITDVIAEQQPLGPTPKTNKFFDSVISGPIPPGSYFIFTNEALPEYISKKQLTEIITTLPPVSAAEQIKRILGTVNIYVPFLGIIIKSTQAPEPDPTPSAQPHHQTSVYPLDKMEKETESILSPYGAINPKQWIKKLCSPLFKKIKTIKRRSLPLAEPATKRRQPIKQKLKSWTKRTGAALLAPCLYLWSKIKLIVGKINSFLRAPSFQLSLKIKIIILVLSLSLAGLILNIWHTEQKKQEIAQQQKYQELSEQIRRKQNQIDAHLIYHNNDGAKKLLRETEQLLAQLPQDSPLRQQQYQEFKQKLENQLNKLRQVNKWENADVLIDVTKTYPNANIKNLILTPNKQKIYLADSGEKSVHILTPSDKTLTTVTSINLDLSQLRSPAVDKLENIYWVSDKYIVRLNGKEETLQSLDIEGVDTKEIAATAIYGERLYVLLPNKNQIYRYNYSSDGYVNPLKWLYQQVDLSRAVDLAIDGFIFVLYQDGQVERFLRGRKTDFKLAAVDPAISQPTKIFTDADSDYLYIFEPSQKRVLVFDKKGKFIVQYQTGELDLKDFTVDENNQIIYLLSENSVVKVPMQHLKKKPD